MMEIGNALREARNRQGLSIRDAEDATKIRSKYLQAMEQDDFEVLPGPTFVMGFLRTYAAYLGLDADGLVDEYRRQYAPHILDAHRLPNTPLRSRPGRPGPRRSNYVVVAVITLVIILLLAWIGWGNRREGETPGGSTTTTLASSLASDDTTSARSSSTVKSSSTTKVSPADSSSTTGTSEGQAALTAVVNAVQDRCYLIVREDGADGKTLYSQTLEEGESESFQTDDALWMNIANPAAIIVNVNGTDHEVPEPYGNFRVTAAGLERLSP